MKYKNYVSGCEVEILGVRPSLCEPYIPNASERNLTDAMERALDALEYYVLLSWCSNCCYPLSNITICCTFIFFIILSILFYIIYFLYYFI